MKRPKGYSGRSAPDAQPTSARGPSTDPPESINEVTESPQAVVTPIASDLPASEPTAEHPLSSTTHDVAATTRSQAQVAVTQARSDAQLLRNAKKRVRTAERGRKRREKHEQRRFSAHARKRKRRVITVVSAVASLAIFVAVGVLTPIMSVRNIEVAGVSRVPAGELVESLMPLKGTPLALVRHQDVHTALEGFPLIQQYSIQKVPPSSLIVTIQERQPAIAVERGDETVLVDPAGVVIETLPSDARPAEVPLGVGIGSDLTSDRFRVAAQVISAIPKETRTLIDSVAAPTPQSITLTLDSGVEVMWGDVTNTSRKLLVLESMLLALADTPVTHIDVSSPSAPVFRNT